MLRYLTAAAVLKMFSVSPWSVGWYRRIGNILETRLRLKRGISDMYRDRARLLLRTLAEYGALEDGQTAIELGTGWVHWDAVIARLFYDVRISLYDVWDCRSLKAFKHTWAEFAEILDETVDVPAARKERINGLLAHMADAESFAAAYGPAGFDYILDPDGMMERIPDNSYGLAFSFHVLEHVPRDTMPLFLRNIRRILKPGGFCIHQIDMCDHLAYYDRSLLPKQYLAYSDRTWKTFFENRVQYINRLQRSEWLTLFKDAGFELLGEQPELQEIGIKPDPQYGRFPKNDLDCAGVLLIHKKI